MSGARKVLISNLRRHTFAAARVPYRLLTLPGPAGPSGRQIVRHHAAQIRARAVEKPNFIAEELNMGACQVATMTTRRNGRPAVKVGWGCGEAERASTSPFFVDRRVKNRSKWVLAYHLTWFAAYRHVAPPPNLRSDYSHRCHEPSCVNPQHGIFESPQTNRARAGCKGNSHLRLPDGTIILNCAHEPPCLSGMNIAFYRHPKIVRGPRPPGPETQRV
jgi:hypothetical protein